MKVILREDVEHLGHMGDTVTVAAGYGRNYLLPRNLAVAADSASAKQVEHELRIIKRREERMHKELEGVKSTLDGVQIDVLAKAGEEGKLFGSITTLHIAEKLAEKGHEVDRRKIILAEPLRSLGEHEVVIRLTRGVEATIKVVISAQEEEAVPS